MSRRWDSNPRPADYKSAALPAELLRLVLPNHSVIIRLKVRDLPDLYRDALPAELLRLVLPDYSAIVRLKVCDLPDLHRDALPAELLRLVILKAVISSGKKF